MLKRFLLSKFENKPTFMFLFITYAIISIFPILVLGGTSFAAIKNIIEKQTIEANIERVKQIQSSVDIILNTIEEKTYTLLMDNSIARIKDIDYNGKTDVNKVIYIMNLISKMKSIELTNELIESIYFYNEDMDFIVASNGYSSELENFYDVDWYKELYKVKGKGSWTGVRANMSKGKTYGSNKAKNVVSFIKTAAPYFQSFNGLLVVNIYERKLNEFLDSIVGQSNEDIFIVDKQGSIITCYDTTLIGTIFSDNIIEDIGTFYSGYIVQKDETNRQFIYYYTVASNGWIYILRNPFNKLARIPKDIGMLTFCLTLLLILANISVSFVLSKKVYIPIDNLLLTVKSAGNYQHKNSRNEFELIDHAIKNMYEEKIKLKDFIERNRQAIKENIMRKLLNDDIDDRREFTKQLTQVCDDLHKKYYSSFILKFKDITPISSGYENIGVRHAIISKICENIQSDKLTCMGMSIEVDKIAFIVNTDDIEMMKRFSYYLINKINEEFSIDANIIHGGYYNNIFDISKSYEEALMVLKNKILLEENSVIFYDQDLLEESEYLRYPEEIENKIINSLQQSNIDEAMKHFKEFVKYIYFRGAYNKNRFENYCIRLISNIIRLVELTGHNVDEIIDCDIYQEFLMKNYYLDDIEEWFYKIFDNVIKKVYTEEEKYMRYKECIRSYIYENYQQDISLETIADNIGISYSYLRKIFIKIFGCSFSYFLNMVRVEKAKVLLETTEKNAYDVAISVGYNNEQSFYRNFKKLTGFTPIEYRRDKIN